MEFFYRYKKMLMVLGFVAIVAVLCFALYYMFLAGPAPVEKPSGGQNATGSQNILPGVGNNGGTGSDVTPGNQTGRLETGEEKPGTGTSVINGETPITKASLNKVNPVTTDEAISATLNPDGSGIQYYNKADGRFYAIGNDGKITPLSDNVFHNVKNVVWAPSKDKAILEYPDNSKIVYDFGTAKQVTLPKHWEDFNFSPDSSQIVMKSLGLDADNRWLAIANSDGSKARGIENIGNNDATVYPSWSPNNQIIAMYTEGIDMNRQEVYFLGRNNENFKSMTVEGRGFDPLWAPDGSRLLYSVYSTDSNLNPALWIANAQGESIGTGRKSLDVNTWADKCTFADAYSLYCAVPENLPQGSGLFEQMAANTTDQLYAIDTRTGTKKLVSTPEGNYTMTNIVISQDGSSLYFTDASTQKIYKINLK